jgi:ABC-2 type transport system ATP-binding protein
MPIRSFSYATQKGQYLSILGTFLFLILSEGMLIIFLVLHFVPTIFLQTLILALIGCFLVGMSGKLLCPLWTCHYLSATELELHYGLDVHARLPRALLVSAQPVQEKTGAFAIPRYDATKQRLSLAFSERGQVLLSLKQPRAFRLGLRTTCLADQILISLDDREAFLAALDLTNTAQTERPAVSDQDLSASSRNKPRIPVQFARCELPPIADDTPVVLRAEGLTRRYASFTAVDSLNLAVRLGEIYGFLGPNGAGKSTTIKMLVGLLQPTAGRAMLAGYDVWRESLAAKTVLGYVADRALLYNRLSGREFLAFLGQLRGLPLKETEERIASLLDLLELADVAERLCGSYSFGMKRKLALAGALLHEPEVLILDEPLNGFDPRSSRRLKDLFAQLAAGGTTIFLSTHDLATAEEICQRIGILHRGRLLAEGSPAELRDLVSAADLESVFLSLTAPTKEVLV